MTTLRWWTEPATGTPDLSPELCEELSRALNGVTPWWIRVRLRTQPGGYRVRVRSVRPPHFRSHGTAATYPGEEAAAVGNDPTVVVREILSDVQHFMAEEVDAAWPADRSLPPMTQPIHEMVAQHPEQHRAELIARRPPSRHPRRTTPQEEAWPRNCVPDPAIACLAPELRRRRRATHSMWGVCGNMSSGRARSRV